MAGRGAHVVACCAGALVLASTAAACTSSGPGKQAPPSVASSSSSSATAAASSVAAAPTPTTQPLSAYESDPGIEAYRAWAAQAARTVNSGHYTSKALEALMTPTFAKTMKHVLGTEVGRYYPGPIPFTPINLRVPSATVHQSDGCLEANGFAQNPKTHKPAAAAKVVPITISTVDQGGTWVMNGLSGPAKISCTGVKIGTSTW